MGTNASIYTDQGGAARHYSGTATCAFESGTALDIESGASLELAGTAIASTAAELNVLSGVTAGTVTASLAVVVDASKNIGDFNNLDAVNIDAGASGTAGTVDVFPATATSGKLSLACTDQAGDTTVTVDANAMGQATTINIPDPGAAASYVVQSTAALTLAEVDVLDAVTAGTVAASRAIVVDGSKDIAAFNDVGAVNFDAGSSGAAGTVDVFPATAARGKFSLSCEDQAGDTAVTLTPAAMGQATQLNIADPGIAASYLMQSTAAVTIAEADVLSGVTPGTVAASKALVVDASRNIASVGNITTSGEIVFSTGVKNPLNMDSIAAYDTSATGSLGNVFKMNLTGTATHTATTAGAIIKNYSDGITLDGNYELSGQITYLKHKATLAGGAKSSLASYHRHGSSDQVVDYGIRVFSADSQLTTLFYASGSMTNFFEAVADGSGGATVGVTDITGDQTADAYLTIDIAGTSYKILAWAA